jgi:hypothetical protein
MLYWETCSVKAKLLAAISGEGNIVVAVSGGRNRRNVGKRRRYFASWALEFFFFGCTRK